MSLPFTIQIPVYNETKALEFSIYYFNLLKLPAHYVLDSQCTPDAELTLSRLGFDVLKFSNDKPFIENGYEYFVAVSPTDWILRLDCDELPSKELINYCADFVRQDKDGVVGFERHQVYWLDNRFLTATTKRFTPVNQRQWRLFNRRRISFDRRIHTSGILLDDSTTIASNEQFYHLSWVFLSWEDRLKKAARYDVFGQPDFNRTNQLFPLEYITWQDLNAPILHDAYTKWLASSKM